MNREREDTPARRPPFSAHPPRARRSRAAPQLLIPELHLARNRSQRPGNALVDDARPRTYAPRQTTNTRPASAELIRRADRFEIRKLMRESDVSQHAIERFLDGKRIHPATRKKLANGVEKLEREAVQ